MQALQKVSLFYLQRCPDSLSIDSRRSFSQDFTRDDR